MQRSPAIFAPGHRRATCTRALSQGWEDDFSDLHSDLQRAIADMKVGGCEIQAQGSTCAC